MTVAVMEIKFSVMVIFVQRNTCKLLKRVVPNGTLHVVEGKGQISPIRSFNKIIW